MTGAVPGTGTWDFFLSPEVQQGGGRIRMQKSPITEERRDAGQRLPQAQAERDLCSWVNGGEMTQQRHLREVLKDRQNCFVFYWFCLLQKEVVPKRKEA